MSGIKKNMSISLCGAYGKVDRFGIIEQVTNKLLNKKSEGTSNEKGFIDNCRNASDCITGQRRNHSACTGR